MDWIVTQSVGLTGRQAACRLCASVEENGQSDMLFSRPANPEGKVFGGPKSHDPGTREQQCLRW